MWMAWLAWLFSVVALAGGSASEAPPAPPAVDFSGLHAAASQRKVGPDNKPHPVHARLLSERASVAAGDTVRLGLHLTQDEGWHTYWKSPGDIGLATEIVWALPEGAAITPHVYPVPQRFEDNGEVSFGYDGEVLLISELTVPAELAPGTHNVRVEANWLVCLTACIPGSAELELPIEVADPGSAATDSVFAPLFAHYTAQHPRDPLTLEGVGWDFSLSTSAVRPEEPFRAAFLLSGTDGKTLAAPGDHAWPTFTPIATSFDWMLTGSSVTAVEGGRILVVLEGKTFDPEPLPTADSIGGLIQVQIDGEWQRAEISAQLPWAAAGTAVTAVASPLWELAGPAPESGEPTPAGDAEHGGNDVVMAAAAVAAPPGAPTSGLSLLINLGLAFIGGLILNVMPCVLPVLTLKLYSLVEQTDITTRERRTAGVAYTVGIVASFLALAITIIVLRVVFGMDVDWGFQFQYPPYVAALATVVFVFGLSLFGVFEIPALGADVASDAASKEGVVGYLFTGVFATLLATPCSAPFLGPAIAYAFGAPTVVLLAIFAMVGLGLAAPFLLIAFVPALYRFLPRPGAWMESFKQLLGFTLIATTVWLVDVLLAQIGAERTVGFMAFLLFVAMGCWIFGHWGGVAATRQRQAITGLVGLAVAAVGAWGFLDLRIDTTPACDDGTLVTDLSFDAHIPWQPFTEDRVAQLAGQPVFIDFTADWCLTCKVNENTILETSTVRTAMAKHGIVPLKADWTKRDATITEWLRRYGRAGVPMYLLLPSNADNDPIVLPEVITSGMVTDALMAASAE